MRRFDVIVLGGGVIGCAIAEELAQHGRSVCLIERGTVGCEASKAAAGILSAQMDLEKPDAFFELCQASRRMYPRWVRHLEQRSGLDLDYRETGILYLALTPADAHTMQTRMHWQLRCGLRVERWSPREVLRHEPNVTERMQAGFFFPTEAQLDNEKLMEALAIACKKAGVIVSERTTVTRLLLRNGKVIGVQTDRQHLKASVVVNCLGSWASLDRTPARHLSIVPAKGQMLVFDAPKRLFRHVVLSMVGRRVVYGVQRRDGRLLVGSTVEFVGFDRRVTLEGLHTIVNRFRRIVRAAVFARCALQETWAGFRPYSQDGLPILGGTPIEGLYVALGHFRHGILLAPITASLLCELLLKGKGSPFLEAFSSSRFLNT